MYAPTIWRPSVGEYTHPTPACCDATDCRPPVALLFCGYESTLPEIEGAAACVGDSRIPVWTLVQLKKLGRSETQLLGDFPSLVQADLDAVWNYYRENPAEIDQPIAAEEMT